MARHARTGEQCPAESNRGLTQAANGIARKGKNRPRVRPARPCDAAWCGAVAKAMTVTQRAGPAAHAAVLARSFVAFGNEPERLLPFRTRAESGIGRTASRPS